MKLKELVGYVLGTLLIGLGIYSQTAWIMIFGVYLIIETMSGITCFVVKSLENHFRDDFYKYAIKFVMDNIVYAFFMLVILGIIAAVAYGLYTLIF